MAKEGLLGVARPVPGVPPLCGVQFLVETSEIGIRNWRTCTWQHQAVVSLTI